MGLLDKVKEQAGQIAEKAQQGLAEGKDKLEDIQAHKRGEALLRDIGAAYYAQVRHGGPSSAVDDAMKAMDAHVTEHGDAPDQATIDITDAPAT